MAKKKMSGLGITSWVLCTIGALNWGLVGAFNFNLVEVIFGAGTITRVIYILVGLAGLYSVWEMIKCWSK